jgi:hypothetical protein
LIVWPLGFVFAVLGCTGLALAIDRHWRAWFGERPQSRRERILLRIAAGAFLGESLAVCLALDPMGIALVFWCVEIMLAAMTVGVVFALRGGRRR